MTRHDLAVAVMRDAATYTVDDPRFSTRKVVGPSMLSLDGDAHAVHRAPFAPPFRPLAVRERFAEAARTEADRLIDSFGARREAELRREFAGPLAASIMARALGLEQTEVGTMLGWYDAIVAAVTEITAGHDPPARGREAFAALRDRLQAAIAADPDTSLLAAAAAHAQLDTEQIVSNAAVLLFGGIETTEGMIANALLHLLERPDALATVRQDPGALDAAIEESLRLEPAAAVIDRYATADAHLAGAHIAAGDLVRDLDQRRQPRSGGLRRSRRARPRSQISRAAISRSPTARTYASAFTWLASRPARRSMSSCAGCPRWRSTRAGRPGSRGSCSASPRRCTRSGSDAPCSSARGVSGTKCRMP